jgi:hypothetical protein
MSVYQAFISSASGPSAELARAFSCIASHGIAAFGRNSPIDPLRASSALMCQQIGGEA